MDKKMIMLGLFVGSAIGGYIPALFGASIFSFASIIGSAVGGLAGIWLAFKLVS